MLPRAHIVITDSGLGGLAICAALDRGLRAPSPGCDVRLTYVNAWPFEDRGYNDLPDASARAAVFDGALSAMAAMRPDRILIACNTLSILYAHTVFSRRPPVPVRGIVDAGVELFAEALGADPASAIVLAGTKTTIESGVHLERLVRRGVDPARVAAVHCHGLAGAIERDVDGRRTAELIEACASRVAEAAPPAGALFVGLCCTHYGYVAQRLAGAAMRAAGGPVRALDPNERVVAGLLGDRTFFERRADAPGDSASLRGDARGESASSPDRDGSAGGAVSVEVVSKVALDDTARHGIARLIEPVSPAVARALLSYALVPALF
jgi:glutamate racemase